MAIFCGDDTSRSLLRWTLSVCLEMPDKTPTVLCEVDMEAIKHHELVELQWAGPTDGGVLP